MIDNKPSPVAVRIATATWYVLSALGFGLVAVDRFAKPLFTTAEMVFVLVFAGIALLVATVAPPWFRTLLIGGSV